LRDSREATCKGRLSSPGRDRAICQSALAYPSYDGPLNQLATWQCETGVEPVQLVDLGFSPPLESGFEQNQLAAHPRRLRGGQRLLRAVVTLVKIPYASFKRLGWPSLAPDSISTFCSTAVRLLMRRETRLTCARQGRKGNRRSLHRAGGSPTTTRRRIGRKNRRMTRDGSARRRA
jgi:hypothetical protein